MTSSLPDFSSSSVKTPAADAASLAALAPATGNDSGSASGPTPGFAALMGASSGPTAAPASGPAPEPPAGVGTCANSPTRMLSEPAPVASVAGIPVEPALSGLGLTAALAFSGLAATAPVAPTTTPATPSVRREITRDMLEEAASFVTSLLQAALPGVQLPQFSGVAADGGPASAGPAGNPAVDATPGLPAAEQKPAAPAFTLAADGAIELKLDLAQLKPAGFKLDLPSDQSVTINAELQRPGEIVVRLEAAATVPASEAGSPAEATLSRTQSQAADAAPDTPTPNSPAATPAFTLAADGAIELKLDLAQLKPAGFKLDLPSDQSVTINAELQRPGEIVVRLEAAATVPASEAPSPAGVSGRAIFAAKYPGLKITVESPGQTGERNFVFTGDKQVKTSSPLTGISVAKTETTMPVAPIEEPRFTRNPEPFSVLPQRAEFQVVVPPAERITVPADAPAGQNFAERAVDTVTSLVDTQFSASMQKSGSVQLRLRFGGEDLNVRVEIRDGAVHTNFHTDSPELRSALAREWQALTVQSPEQMRRYLEPVFSPAPASASTDTPSSFTRQQQQSQQDLPSRTPRESWAEVASPFSRRSQLSDSFIPETVVTRGPSFLPTSLRLSVLA